MGQKKLDRAQPAHASSADRHWLRPNTNRPPRVLICVEDQSGGALLNIVMEDLGWEIETANLLDWVNDVRPVHAAPDLLVLSAWWSHRQTLIPELASRVEAMAVPCIVLLEEPTDAPVARQIGAQSLLSLFFSLDDLMLALDQALGGTKALAVGI
jgi:hypothetical protein